MTRSFRSLILLGLLVLVACANPATDKTEAVVEEPAEETQISADGQRFSLLDESTIGFAGSKVTGSHDGGFKAFEGEIVLVDGDPTQSSVEIVIDTTSLWADNERLTGHLKSADFFDVEAHPQVKFKSTEIVREDEGYSVTGNLDLHGVKKSITFPATIVVDDGGVRAQAEFFIQRFDFGIEYKGKADDLIRDEVVIQFDFRAAPASP
jgi:polyisoprenoid-binding protein YceI